MHIIYITTVERRRAEWLMAQAKQLFGLCYHYHFVDVEHARGVGHSGLVWMCNYCGGCCQRCGGENMGHGGCGRNKGANK